MDAYPLILTTIAFFSTLSGGLLAAKYRKRLGFLAAFASGVLIAVALFDLLPETLKIALALSVPIENIMYITAAGFIFLLVLERYFSVHHVCEGDCSARPSFPCTASWTGSREASASISASI
jgi:zinc transporter ZupT